MATSRFTGPIITSGGASALTGVTVDGANEYPGPSCFAHGVGLVDQRFGPFNGADVSAIIPVWYGSGAMAVIDQAPGTLHTNTIAAAQTGSAGLVMVLAGASTGITVLAAPLALATNVVPSGCLVMDGNPAFINVGTQAGGVSMYDPRKMVQRALTITSAGTDTSGTASIVGYDAYGFQVHQTITLGSAGVPVTTAKTFKFVQSITLAGTLSGSNVSVGPADVYGFPLAVYEWPYVRVYWAGTLISANTGFVAAVTTSPATAATGDVRGTYATQSASNGTNLLQVFVQPEAWNLSSAGIFGVTQF
jgi:hypothetical protein